MSSDYGQIGNSLRQRDVQYVANRDEYGIWRILDTWHPEMAAMTLTDDLDIPDDSNAVTVLKEGQFLALMKEVEIQGYMPSVEPNTALGMDFGIAHEGNGIDQSKELEEVIKERDHLLLVIKALEATQVEDQALSDDHEYRMRKLDLYETMSNKGNLDLNVAEMINNSGD